MSAEREKFGMRVRNKGLVLASMTLLLLPAACSRNPELEGQGLRYAKTSLAQRLRDAQNSAAWVLEKYPRGRFRGKLRQELGPDIREEIIEGEKVTWILDLLGSGAEPDWFGQTVVDIRGCFKLYSPGGTRIITEQYDCGSQPAPGYEPGTLTEYKGTIRDCELDVCKPISSPTPTPTLP